MNSRPVNLLSLHHFINITLCSHLYSHRKLTVYRSLSTSQIQATKLPKNKDDFYSLLLSSPLATPASISRFPKQEAPSTPSVSHSNSQRKASVIFGSRLAGPTVHAKESWGLRRPQEPDNCCMSGCVNCVWDSYREEVEEWAAKRRQTERAGRHAHNPTGEKTEHPVRGEEELFEGLDVGIREFIAMEKRLKEREKGRIGAD